jgi:hypothetical protein
MPFLPTVKGLYPFKFAYNMIQVMLCSYMCIEAGVRAYSAGYTLLPCNNFDHENPPIAFILYVFYISKILDFMDTVFIILEKRWKQLSFLHVYHHTSIFLVRLSFLHSSSHSLSEVGMSDGLLIMCYSLLSVLLAEHERRLRR